MNFASQRGSESVVNRGHHRSNGVRGYACLLALMMILSSATPLDAGYNYRFDSRSVKMGQFESEMSAKFTRGLINTSYGWTELFRTPIEWAAEPHRGVLSALTIGVPYGILRMLGRTLVGIYEITTAYAPQDPIFAPIEGDVL